jgi:hypothetical protein
MVAVHDRFRLPTSSFSNSNRQASLAKLAAPERTSVLTLAAAVEGLGARRVLLRSRSCGLALLSTCALRPELGRGACIEDIGAETDPGTLFQLTRRCQPRGEFSARRPRRGLQIGEASKPPCKRLAGMKWHDVLTREPKPQRPFNP